MKNKKLRRTGIFALILSLLVFLSACGGKEAEYKDSAYSTSPASSNYNYMPGNDSMREEEASYSDEPKGTQSPDYNYESPAEKGEEVAQSTFESTEKLVYTCRITLETTEFQKTTSAIKDLINKYGGFIQEDTVSDNDNYWYFENYRKSGATLDEYVVIRIPTQNYNSFLDELNGQGKIRSKNQQVENITRAYNDTLITIESLKTQEERLLDMMKQASTIEEMIYVEDRLSEVQNELKMYESRLSGMDLDVAYSTVTLSIKEVLEYSKDVNPVKTSTFADRLKNTINDSWKNFLSFMEDLLFFLIRALPVILVLAVIGVVLFFIIRKIIKGASGKKDKPKKQPKEAVFVQNTELPEKEE